MGINDFEEWTYMPSLPFHYGFGANSDCSSSRTVSARTPAGLQWYGRPPDPDMVGIHLVKHPIDLLDVHREF